MKISMAYQLLMLTNKKYIKTTYGVDYYKKLKLVANEKLKEIQPKIPDIGKSLYSLNYAFIMAYVPFFHAFNQFDETKDMAGELIFIINENLIKKIPTLILLRMGKLSISQKWLKKLKKAQKQGELGLLHPMDWKIEVIENIDGTYWCNTKECGALKVLKEVGEDSLFPYPCRIDYLMAHLTGNKFERTKTLGDGNECCNNHMMGLGHTEWSPQKGFALRK